MATILSESADKPVARTIVERNNVKKVKLPINPVTIPNGFLLPPPIDPERTMGSTGRIHGERIVIIPPINANKIRMIIYDVDNKNVDSSFEKP